MSLELQKYKGTATRHQCPKCSKKGCFVLYIDTNTNKPIHRTVGRCNRESSCGYHYTPKQYFIDNGSCGISRPKYTTYIKPVEIVRPMGILPIDLVEKSNSLDSNFGRFLGSIFNDKSTVEHLCSLYSIGATRAKEVIFWQIDLNGILRTGKVMQYDPSKGKRQNVDWIHSRMIKVNLLPVDFNLKQCFFGEHLLKLNTTGTIAIVESEKTAIIATGLMPDLIWIAAGQKQGLNIEKCKALTGRNVILFPDLSEKKENKMTAFEVWNAKATEIMKAYKCKVIVSDLLERKANETDRKNGLDIADYLINEQRKKVQPPESSQEPPPALESSQEPPPEQISLYDLAIEVIGKQNNKTKSDMLNEMIRKYNVSDTWANGMIIQLVDNKIIEFIPNVERYCMKESTPF